MTLKECYCQLDGDYDDVLGRLLNEERVKKFVKMFLQDESYALLCQSLEAHNYDEAFRASHTMKGTCLNLSFTRLFHSSDELTEQLRHHHYDNLDQYMNKVKEDYSLTIQAIQELN
jgi:HPt (histidine-containing phosphotransfer) domain-containing protein